MSKSIVMHKRETLKIFHFQNPLFELFAGEE